MSIFAPIFEHYSPKFLWLDFVLDAVVTHQEGRLHWNADDGTLEIGLSGGSVNLQIGQELLLPRGKAIGSAIANGNIVYVSGASGSKPELSLAKADVVTTSSGTIAMATEGIPENQNGYYTSVGLVRDVNTSGCSEGDTLYLSASTAGAFTNVKPEQPNLIIKVGYCLRAHIEEGVIFVYINQRTNNYSHIRGMTPNLIPFANTHGFLDESENLSYVDGKLKVGTATNYTEIEADGTIISYGDATCWDDIALSATSLGVGATAPDLVNINGSGIFLRAFNGASITEQLFGSFEIPHTYAEGTNLVPHIHWMPTTTGAGNVKFYVDYWRVTAVGGSIAPSTATTISTTGNTNSTAWETFTNSTTEISGTGVKIGDQIAFRLYRDPADDTYGADAAVLTFGIHYQINSLGSRLITTK